MGQWKWEAYASFVSLLLLVMSVGAFSDNLFTNVGQPSNRDPKFIVHGLFGLAWYVLLAVQANLVRVRKVKIHRQVGKATFLVAVGLVLSTLYIFVAVWKGWAGMSDEAQANRLLLPGFAVCILFAWLRRAQSDWHKRLILAGTFMMLGPVLSRSYDRLIVSWMEPAFPAFTAQLGETGFLGYFIGVWIGLYVSLAVYDWMTLRRIHTVTLSCFGWVVLCWTISFLT